MAENLIVGSLVFGVRGNCTTCLKMQGKEPGHTRHPVCTFSQGLSLTSSRSQSTCHSHVWLPVSSPPDAQKLADLTTKNWLGGFCQIGTERIVVRKATRGNNRTIASMSSNTAARGCSVCSLCAHIVAKNLAVLWHPFFHRIQVCDAALRLIHRWIPIVHSSLQSDVLGAAQR